MDQKTCLKCIVSANLTPVVIENCLVNDTLVTNVEAIQMKIQEIGPENICCVISTTSCFAPLGCAPVAAIAKLCHQMNVPHIINNAYGVQSYFLCKYDPKRMKSFEEGTERSRQVIEKAESMPLFKARIRISWYLSAAPLWLLQQSNRSSQRQLESCTLEELQDPLISTCLLHFYISV